MDTKSIQKSTIRINKENTKKSYSKKNILVKNMILGVGVTNDIKKNILEYISNSIKNSSENYYVVTPNPEIMVLAYHQKPLRDALNRAQIALCDGIGLLWAARLLGQPLKERIIGTNFMKNLCEKIEDWPITVGFLGGGPGVAEKAADCLLSEFPRLKIAFIGQEWNEKKLTDHSLQTTGKKSAVGASQKAVDILFVAFGAPKQELWMQEHLNKIPVRIMVGVGGAFDQIVHPSLRPPTFIHVIGLGWLYRLIREPWRLKRQLRLLEFIQLVFREKFVYAR